MCGNGLFGGNNITWVLVILIVLLGCGGNMGGCGGNIGGCGCNNNCGGCGC